MSWLNWLTPRKKLSKTKCVAQESQLLVADLSVRVIRKPIKHHMTGEVHDYLGQAYRLHVVEGKGKQQVVLTEHGLQMTVSAQTTLEKRAALMDAFYRATLKDMMPSLLAKWQPIMGVQANDWGIKAMKTRWGTCNTRDKRIWMSLMLAKSPPECIEYVLVHELTYLLERNHTPRFHALMTQFLPHWVELKQKLNGHL
jgi:hypothetical protein